MLLHVTTTMATSVNHGVAKRFERPVQIWVPDTRRAGFAEACLRQSKTVALSDAFDTEFDAFADAALADLDDEALREKVGEPFGRLDDDEMLSVTRSLAVFIGLA